MFFVWNSYKRYLSKDKDTFLIASWQIVFTIFTFDWGPLAWKPRQHSSYTVRKMGLILCRPQLQYSMARKFMLQPLCRYNVKHSKISNLRLTRHDWSKLKNTGGARSNIWICSPRIYHCATVSYEGGALFWINTKNFAIFNNSRNLRAYVYKMVENALHRMLLKLTTHRVKWFFAWAFNATRRTRLRPIWTREA
jgi:hypothetical protein